MTGPGDRAPAFASFADCLARTGCVVLARGNGADGRRTRDVEMCEERPPYLHTQATIVGGCGWAGGIHR